MELNIFQFRIFTFPKSLLGLYPSALCSDFGQKHIGKVDKTSLFKQ